MISGLKKKKKKTAALLVLGGLTISGGGGALGGEPGGRGGNSSFSSVGSLFSSDSLSFVSLFPSALFSSDFVVSNFPAQESYSHYKYITTGNEII